MVFFSMLLKMFKWKIIVEMTFLYFYTKVTSKTTSFPRIWLKA